MGKVVMTQYGPQYTEHKFANGIIRVYSDDCHYVPSKRFIRKEKELIMGYRIRAVYKNGAAKKAGLKEGDLIVKVDNTKIRVRTNLDSALRWKRPGTAIKVKVKNPSASSLYRTVDVVLGSRKRKGKLVGSLGVISHPGKAAAYKTRLVAKANAEAYNNSRKKKARKKPVQKPTAKDLSEDLAVHTVNEDENHFMKQAKEEMSGALVLMEEMEGADALMAVRRLRQALRNENMKSIDRASLIVNKHLNALKQQRIDEEEEALGGIVVKKGKLIRKGKRTFAWKRALWLTTKAVGALALLGGTGIGGYLAYVTYF